MTEALFEAAPERYTDRNGGYTRIVRTLRRRGDNAEMAIIELVARRRAQRADAAKRFMDSASGTETRLRR